MKFYITLLIITLLILGAGYAVYISTETKSKPVISYSVSDESRPISMVDNTFVDVGKIKVSDDTTRTFTLRNVGLKPLQISQLTTSCGCTAVQIEYNKQISREYSMHGNSDDVIDIAPGTSAVIKMIYRPYTMPVYGNVEREAYLTTNDPLQPKISLKMKANVQR